MRQAAEQPIEWYGLSFDEYTVIAAVAVSVFVETFDDLWRLLARRKVDM